ncbi:hypothetical protein WR25_18427 [Diploscapter pachys]|uniref:Metalloendopeptidase n=1 Tax=Diploscapter pachys TaxID=2018661 RepID=A0A2A2JC59_9BILA|nr:hypothetical protein WR25_18427 [Diploscapter pachys]
MKSIIHPSTCISFVVNATARNRVKIVSDPTIDFCESSDVGCKSKEQTITMGSKCIYDGAFAKAIFHVLGFYTMERRSDRDNFVDINSNSVNPAMTDGLAIINSTYSTNLLGYNFGSVIHSTYDMFVYGGSTDYPILPKDNAYFYTMGGPIVTSYDLNMLQLFYYCNSEYQCEQIKSSQSQFRQLSKSHGHMRKLGCSEYSFMQHMQLPSRPADGGQQLTATTSWTSLTVTITGTASISDPGPYSTKTYWIVKPAGYSYVEFQYVSFSSAQTKFSPGCRDLGLELKYLSNQQLANPRVCSDAWNGLSSSSPLATTPIVAYTSTISATFVLQFRATNTNVTDVKPPPPPFLSSNVYKHVHIDVYKHDHYFM